jgi:outer membrane protein OmpA-like peptidoglycan-associated protein
MIKKTLTLSTIAMAALLSACASNRTTPPALSDARTAVQSAQTDPLVLNNAALELKKATDALKRAEDLNGKGESLAEVESAAYVATRQAQTAMTIAQAKRDEDAIKTAEVERERARADARGVEARRAQAAAMAARVDATVARDQAGMAQQQADASRMQAMDAEQRARAAREQAMQAQATTVVLQQQLTDLKAQHTERGTLVTLGDVLFESGSSDIKPGAVDALRKLASFLQQHPERMVAIEGFTDSVGNEAFNVKLSQRRAESVAAALAQVGIAPQRIVARGYGETFPVADNSSATNRALNRRVEVYISDNDQPVRARG